MSLYPRDFAGAKTGNSLGSVRQSEKKCPWLNRACGVAQKSCALAGVRTKVVSGRDQRELGISAAVMRRRAEEGWPTTAERKEEKRPRAPELGGQARRKADHTEPPPRQSGMCGSPKVWLADCSRQYRGMLRA
jgi:hypothetical protein